MVVGCILYVTGYALVAWDFWVITLVGVNLIILFVVGGGFKHAVSVAI